MRQTSTRRPMLLLYCPRNPLGRRELISYRMKTPVWRRGYRSPHTNPQISSEDIPYLKRTLHDSQKTSLKENYDSLKETSPSLTILLTSTEDDNLKYFIIRKGRNGKPYGSTPSDTLLRIQNQRRYIRTEIKHLDTLRYSLMAV